MHKKIKEIKDILKIIKNEENFKIQILTIESHKTFLDILNSKKIFYNFSYFSDPIINLENKRINFIFQNKPVTDFKFSILGKYILFGNSFHFDFIQFTFKISNEIKNQIISKKRKNKESFDYLIPHYNLYELETQLNQTETSINYFNHFDINYLKAGILNEFEISILFVVSNNPEMKDILSNLKNLNEDFSNAFKITLALNKLIEHSFIKLINRKYYISISKEFLIKLCKEIGHNLN